MAFETPKLNIRIRDSIKRKFSKPSYDASGDLPTSLSPISTFDDSGQNSNTPNSFNNYLFSTNSRSFGSDYSPTPTATSLSSLNSNESYQSQPSFSGVYERNKYKGPKIKPYAFTQSRQPNHSRINKNIGSNKCFICDELIQNKLVDENTLELKCGDFIHEQCLNLQVNYNIDKLLYSNTFTANKLNLANKILPNCKGECCKGFNNKIGFVDNAFHDSILNSAIAKSIDYDRLLINKITVDLIKPNKFASLSSSSPDIHESLNISLENYHEINRVQEVGSNSLDKIIASEMNEKCNSYKSLKPPIDLPFRLARVDSMFSYRSLVRSPSPAPTVSTVNNNDLIKIKEHQSIPIDTLKNLLLRNLIRNCSDLDLTTLIRLGNLRLADNLLIKWSELQPWSLNQCYLFDNYLMVINNLSYQYELLDLHNFSFLIENGSVKVLNNKTIWLNSDLRVIIEKWCIALLDCSFIFPSEILTSTLNIDDSNRVDLTNQNLNIIFDSEFDPLINSNFGNDGSTYDTGINLNILANVPISASTLELKDLEIVEQVEVLQNQEIHGDNYKADSLSFINTAPNSSHMCVDLPRSTISSLYIDSDDDKINEILAKSQITETVDNFYLNDFKRNKPNHYNSDSEQTDICSDDSDSDQANIISILQNKDNLMHNWTNLIADIDNEINSHIA